MGSKDVNKNKEKKEDPPKTEHRDAMEIAMKEAEESYEEMMEINRILKKAWSELRQSPPSS